MEGGRKAQAGKHVCGYPAPGKPRAVGWMVRGQHTVRQWIGKIGQMTEHIRTYAEAITGPASHCWSRYLQT